MFALVVVWSSSNVDVFSSTSTPGTPGVLFLLLISHGREGFE